MPSLDDIYRKFGEVAEAAQLLETELGSNLLFVRGLEESLFEQPAPARATQIYHQINRHTLGKLLKALDGKTPFPDDLEALLAQALKARNRLSHSFYRRHNFRRNSEEGRIVMLADLESIRTTILAAYKAVMLLSGIDLGALAAGGEYEGPTEHVPI